MTYVVTMSRHRVNRPKGHLIQEAVGPFTDYQEALNYAARQRTLWSDQGARVNVALMLPPVIVAEANR
jgi:hypothetical protein